MRLVTAEKQVLLYDAMYGEGNGTPLQYSCLENPMDGEAWWAAVHGFAQSPTRLKRLSSSSSSTMYREKPRRGFDNVDVLGKVKAKDEK